MGTWIDFDTEYIRRRYNRIAPIYPIFELVFWLPWGIRAHTAERLELKLGDRVLEIGCGTGRNFPYLQRAIGPTGHLYGVDLTEGMLAVARDRCARRGWKNVTLLNRDAADYTLPEPVDAALFSLSYEVIPHHREALRRAWAQLRPGKHLIVLGGKAARGPLGALFGRLATWTSRVTVLGNPNKRPWEDLRALTPAVEVTEFLYGTYYVCRGTKPTSESA